MVPAGVHSASTVISLRVSVPVLSVQMTVVLPSVSTAGRWRMMAWRRAMRRTPIAEAIVITAGRPSGIDATASVIAAKALSTSGYSRSSPTTKISAATVTMPSVMARARRPSRRVSGVSSAAVSLSNCEMRPSSVLAPVAVTTPFAVPATTSVPPKAIDWRSPSAASPSTGPSSLAAGSDSPVSIASSTFSPFTSNSRTSAET